MDICTPAYYACVSMSTPPFPISVERRILLLVGAVQFVNILDFMMVMPLGPDFGPALGIHVSELGWVGGSYTAAAAIAGVISSLFIDRLDRKTALMFCLAGLVVATAAGGFAWNLPSLLLARIVAGMFGGPATSLAWSIVADVVEPARRGKAMGKVMGAFSVAAVIGVPFGLEMARLHNWTMPFFVTAALGLVVMLCVAKFMPSLRLHLAGERPTPSLLHLISLLRRPLNLISYLYIALAMMASFMIIPNISAYVQYNLRYPREHIGWLYSVGGLVSFFTMRATGRLIDRYSATFTSALSALCYVCVLWIAFLSPVSLPVIVFFMLFMFALGMRNVSSTTLATKIPSPQERAGFMSLFSCMQGIGMASGAFLSTRLLTEAPDKSLVGMPHIAMMAMALSFAVPLLMGYVERRLVKPQ